MPGLLAERCNLAVEGGWTVGEGMWGRDTSGHPYHCRKMEIETEESWNQNQLVELRLQGLSFSTFVFFEDASVPLPPVCFISALSLGSPLRPCSCNNAVIGLWGLQLPRRARPEVCAGSGAPGWAGSHCPVVLKLCLWLSPAASGSSQMGQAEFLGCHSDCYVRTTWHMSQLKTQPRPEYQRANGDIGAQRKGKWFRKWHLE